MASPVLCGPLYAAVRRPRFVLPALALLAGASLFSTVPSARAATKYWEPTGSTGTNASGTWNTSGVSWTTDSTGASGPNTTFGNSTYSGTYIGTGTVSGTYTSTNAAQALQADDAVFSADPAITGMSTVTLGATLVANSVTFGNAGVTNGGAAAGFTFAAGNTLTVGNYTAAGNAIYTGNTAITLNASAGPVIFNNQVNLVNGLPDAAGASTINYSIANNSSNALTFNGIFVANTRPNNTNDTVNLTFSGTGGVTFNGALTANTVGTGNLPTLSTVGGNFNLIISGGGAVALNAANFNNGSVALSNGSLTLGNSQAMQALALNQTGGTFSFGTLTAATIAGLTGTSTLTLTNSGGAAVALNDVGFAGNGTVVAPSPTFAGNINGLGSLTINGVASSGGNGTGGTATFSGVLGFTGAGGLTINDLPPAGKVAGGASTVVLTNANTYTGPTTVTLPGGGLTLNGNGAITGTSAITLNGGGFPPGSTTVGTTTLLYDNTVNGTASRLGTAPITLNGATLNYKAVTTGTGVAGTGSSGAITVGGALTSTFTFNAASGTGNTSNFTIASLSNANHGTLNAALGNANLNTNFITVTAAPALINGILPWTYETTNGNFLSVNASKQLNAYNNVGTDATTFNNTATSNVQLAAASTTPTAAVAENSLIVNFGGTQGLGGQALTLTSGGLVFKAANGVLGSAANDGSITTAAANPELYINAAANGTINSTITDAGSTSVAVTKFGAGTLTLTGTNTYTGGTIVEQGTLANQGTIGALSISPGGTATLFGTSVTGAILDNGTLNFQTGTAGFTTGNITGTTGTGVITYTSGSAVNTLNFSGTNSFLGLNNTSTTGSLVLAGPGSVNTFFQFPNANTGLTTTTTTFQSGTYFFTTGGSNVNANDLGAAFNVSGANVTFTNGLRFLDNGGGTVNVNSGLLQSFTNFDTNQEVSGTTVNINVKGGVLDVATSGASIGNEGSEAAATTDNLTVSGGIFQVGFTSSTSTQNITIGGSSKTNVNATVALQPGGTIRDNGTIQSGGALGTGSTSNFNWTGGTLTASTVNMANLTDNDGITTSPVAGTLYNGGGTLAPGYFGQALGSAFGSANAQFTGKTTITGNYQVDSANAALAINLGGTGATGGFGTTPNQYDNVAVSGTAVIGGRLNVGLINAFTPTSANTFTILTTGNGTKTVNSLTGTFANTEIGKAATPTDVVVGSSGLNAMSVTYNAGTASAVGSVVLGNYAAGNTYTGATGSSWDAAAAANWSVFDPGSTTAPATVASGAVAQFADGAGTGTGADTVVLNSTRNIQGIQFSSATAGHNYTINNGGSGAVILDNTANAAAATITDSSASGNANAINVPVTLNSALVATVTNAANTLSIGGAISGASTASVTKSGAGTLALTGTSSYTGPTNVSAGTLSLAQPGTNTGAAANSSGTYTPGTLTGATAITVSNGGTLLLSASYALNQGSNVNISGTGTAASGTGAINLGNNVLIGQGANNTTGSTGTSAQGVGMLTLTSNSTLYYAGASGTLVFNSFAPNSHTLDIEGASLNFASSSAASGVDGTNDRLIFLTDPTSAGLADITIAGQAVTDINLGAGNGFEIVAAVPEPSTWMSAMLMILGAVGIKFRRRKAQVN